MCCMTKTVRIREHLAAEVERLAKEERRSLANMVEVLLEQAMGFRPIETDVPEIIVGAAVPHKMDHSRPPKAPPPPVEREFKPDFGSKLK